MKLFNNICLLSVILFTYPISSQAFWGDDKIVIKIGHYHNAQHPQNIALMSFEKEVEEKSKGAIDIKIYPNSQLGSEEQVINGLRNGTIEMGLFGSLMYSLDPKLGFMETPFLFRDFDHARRALDSDVGREISKTFEKYGVKHLAYSPSGFRVISSNKKVESPKDYKTLRMRVPNLEIFVDMGRALGINVQAMAITEVFTALEQGVVDAQENPLSLIKSQGFYEIQKYIIETNHMFTVLNLGINKKLYESLDPEYQEILNEAAINFNQLAWKLTVEDYNKTKDFFIDSGIEFITPSESLKKWNQQAMEPLYKKMFEKNEWAEAYVNKINSL